MEVVHINNGVNMPYQSSLPEFRNCLLFQTAAGNTTYAPKRAATAQYSYNSNTGGTIKMIDKKRLMSG